MRTLDRYITRNFLYSVLLCFVVLMSLRIVADLCFNIDEFAKQRGRDPDKTAGMVIRNVSQYYGFRSLAYFREVGGVIIVIAAAFSLARMNHANELTAILASGVSLRRVLLPVITCAVGLNTLIILDNELLIPRAKHQLVRDRADPYGIDTFQVRLVTDGAGNAWWSRKFEPAPRRLLDPLVVLRDEKLAYAGHITAGEAVYQPAARGWLFTPSSTGGKPGEPPRYGALHVPEWHADPTAEFIPVAFGPEGAGAVARICPEDLVAAIRANPCNQGKSLQGQSVRSVEVKDPHLRVALNAGRLVMDDAPEPRVKLLEDVRITFFRQDDKPLVVFTATQATYRGTGRGSGYALSGGALLHPSDLDPAGLALRQSSEWLNYLSTAELTQLLRLQKVSDPEATALVRYARFADFFNNIVMLLIAVPFILSRERNLKSSAGLMVLAVGIFFVFIYFSRNIGLSPVLAAWLPILIFGPIAALMLDAVKT